MLSHRCRSTCTVSVVLWLLGFPPAWTAEAAALRVGWAKVDLTPSFACPLAGFGKRRGAHAIGVHDPLYARALILQSGGEKIALVSVDLVLITQALRDAVAQRLAPLQLTALLLSATHTHSGIGGYWNNALAEVTAMGEYQERIFRFLRERIVQAVQEAEQKTRPARIGMGSVAVAGLNRNRQQRGGPVDPELGVIRIDSATGQPLAALVNFSAHATVLGPQNLLLSADYPGVLTATLEERVPIALFAAGASGNLSPRSPRGKDRYERATTLGHTLAQHAQAVLTQIVTKEDVALASRTQEVRLTNATSRGFLPFPLFVLADPLLRFFTPSTTVIQAIRINDLVLSAWPGEVDVALGLQLKEWARHTGGYQTVWVVSLANDYIGYILAEPSYRLGGYEARMSFFGPRFGETLQKQMVTLLRLVR